MGRCGLREADMATEYFGFHRTGDQARIKWSLVRIETKEKKESLGWFLVKDCPVKKYNVSMERIKKRKIGI